MLILKAVHKELQCMVQKVLGSYTLLTRKTTVYKPPACCFVVCLTDTSVHKHLAPVNQ